MSESSQNPEALRQWTAIRANPRVAQRWDWHALIRLIQAANPDKPPVGHGVVLEEDPIRLGQVPYMHPPQVAISDLRESMGAGADVPPQLLSFPVGLFGPMGPLPLHLTEHAARGWKKGGEEGESLAAFANIIHHRFLSYHFRAWADVRKEIDWDRASTQGSNPTGSHWAWLLYVGSLVGIGLDSMRQIDRVPDAAKLYFAGRLMSGCRNAEGLAAILSEYFAIQDVEVVQFVPRRLRIPEDSMWRLGGDASTGVLGQSTLVGEFTEVAQDGFRIQVGPVGWEQFKSLLPGTPGHGEFTDWIRLYVGPQSGANAGEGVASAWDLHLILKADEVPECRLDGNIQLGWSSWLSGRPPGKDADELILQPDS